MKHIFTNYKLELVKEESKKYEVDNVIESPDDIYNVCKNILRLDKQAEEVLQILALNNKNKVIGLFEVSRGSIDSSICNPREIFKRLLLINASKFILAHNHPSGDETPSKDDILIAQHIKQCGDLLNIELLDFCVIGKKLYSFKSEFII